MYWNDSTSSIDTLVSQEGVTLIAILNEDDVLQECIGQNNALLEFLSDDIHLTEMLSVIAADPTTTENDMERFKNANTVCEILTYDGNIFMDIIVKNDKYLSQLWSFVSVQSTTESQDGTPDSGTHSTAPLNPLLASFFTKVFLYLFTHQIDLVLDFLARQEAPNDLVSVVLRHINTSAIMDLVYKSWEYINLDKKIGQEKIDKFNDLLLKNCFIEKLVDIFSDTSAETKQQNAAILMSDLIKTGRELLIHNSKEQVDGLLAEFEKVEVSRTLLGNMLQAQTKHSIASGLKIVQDLLVYRMQIQHLINQQNEHLSSIAIVNGKSEAQDDNLEGMPTFLKAGSSPTNEFQFMPPQLSSPVDVHGEHLTRCVRNVCAALDERLEDFISLLVNPVNLSPIATTVGVINSPLGPIRLEVIHLFVALFATSEYPILEKCSKLSVLKLLTDLFFEYSLNNQLHKYYEQIIEYLFQNYSNFKIIYDKHYSNGTLEAALNVTANASEQSDQVKLETSNQSASVENSELKSSESATPASNGSVTPPNKEKIAYFIKLYEMSKVLVKQIIVDCHLIEKIVDSFAQEKVPLKSSQKSVEEAPKIKVEVDDSKREESQVEPVASEITDVPKVKVEVDDSKIEETHVEPVACEDSQNNAAESSQVSESSSEIKEEPKPQVSLLKSLRPSYMGHLRLIANVLKEKCSDELLSECDLDNEVLQQWNEFKTGKLTQFNELIQSKLVPESKNEESNDQDIFQRYQIESVSQALPANIELLPNDFEQQALGDINEQLKLVSGPDFDFDKLWTQTNEKLGDFEKYFDEKCSSIFDDEDDDPFNNLNSDENIAQNPLGTSFKKERPSLLSTTLKNEFDPFLNTSDIKEEVGLDAGFANFTEMGSDPWAESAVPPVANEIDQLPQWSADFANDPFAGNEVAPTATNNNETEVQADFSTSLPNTSSPKRTLDEQ